MRTVQSFANEVVEHESFGDKLKQTLIEYSRKGIKDLWDMEYAHKCKPNNVFMCVRKHIATLILEYGICD